MAEAFDLSDGIRILERTPAVLDAWLRGLPTAWTHANEGPETWSAFDVVGHLVHGEKTDWIPRARIILADGDARPLDPFDRFAQLQRTDETLDRRLDELASLRRTNLETLRGWNLSGADLDRRGHHPTLGPVTLAQLLSTWTAHDLNHVIQIARVMATRYRDAVGPWSEFLRVMR